MNVQDAVDAPRIHHQWLPDRLDVEKEVSPDTIALLQHMGYAVEAGNPQVTARVEAIEISGGWLQGGHDGRGTGKAEGYWSRIESSKLKVNSQKI